MITRLVQRCRRAARRRRADLFRRTITTPPGARVLDLGSEDGSHIHSVVPAGTDVYIADIDAELVHEGARRYGYHPVVLEPDQPLPFPDGYFDIVFCSSVIEHVTGFDKAACWNVRDTETFRRTAKASQQAFAAEIRRVGNQYFVQTPNRWFPIEAHTWLPAI